MGVCFVSFVSQYGYDRVLSVLGRHMRDFLNVIFNFICVTFEMLIFRTMNYANYQIKLPGSGQSARIFEIFISTNESAIIHLWKWNQTRAYATLSLKAARFRLLHYGSNTWGMKLKFQFQITDDSNDISNLLKFRTFLFPFRNFWSQVARHFYHKEMHIELIREEILFDTVHVTFQLTFDNRAFTLASLAMTREEKHLPISASVLFEIFPFCVVFG